MIGGHFSLDPHTNIRITARLEEFRDPTILKLLAVHGMNVPCGFFLIRMRDQLPNSRSIREVEFVLEGEEARIRAQRIEFRLNLEKDQPVRSVGIRLFEPVHCQVAFAQP